MLFELDKGDFFITQGDKTISLGKGIPYTEKIEMSAKENAPHLYHLKNIPGINFEVYDVDLANLNHYYNMPSPNDRFILKYKIPIMIQARWHKKSRIRKKWLKRFGMKPDTIKCRASATAGEYNPDDGNFEFETDVPEFLWRQDQLRNGLKIEW